MYSIIQENGKSYNGYTEYVVDTADEIKELPTEDIAVGSVCLVINNSQIYMLNHAREWKLFGW